MPRDSSGNYSLPSTVNPVLTGTVISSTWANTTLNDIATEMTDSLDRSGKGGMIAAFKIADGAVGAPGLSFVSEPTTGFYRVGAGQIGVSIAGSNVATFTGTGVTFQQSTTIIGQPYLNVTGATIPANGVYLSAANTLAFSTNTVLAGSVSPAGAWTFQGTAGNVTINSTTAANAAISFYNLAGVNKARIGVEGTAGATVTGSAVGDTIFYSANGNFLFSNAGAAPYFRVQNNGLVSAVDPLGNTFDLGWRDCPQNQQTVNYQLVLADRGKSVQFAGGGTLTLTIPSNASVAFPVGTTILIDNNTGPNLTIQITTDTLNLAGTATTGTRLLATNGLATIYKYAPTGWRITGAGVS